MAIEDFKCIPEIDSFLDSDEIGKLFLFLMHENRIYPFELRTKRKRLFSLRFCAPGEYESYYYQFSTELTTGHDIFIGRIKTTIPSLECLEFKFSLKNEVLESNASRIHESNKIVLVFPDPLVIKTGFTYELSFSFFDVCFFKCDDLRLKKANSSKDVSINLESDLHCIDIIDYFI